MIIYEKVFLYVYPHLDAIIKSLDGCVMKRALHSFSDYSSALKQAENIVNLTNEKTLLLNLKDDLDDIISTFSPEDVKYFEYKYFKTKRKSYFEDFDFTSRQYFRKQVRLAKEFRKKLEKKGYTEEYYDNYYHKIDLLLQVEKRVAELEKMSYKNKKKDPNISMIKRCQKISKNIFAV